MYSLCLILEAQILKQKIERHLLVTLYLVPE